MREIALLLIDASQGVEAQTLANAQLADAQGLTIIPVINKVDLPSADIERYLIKLRKSLLFLRMMQSMPAESRGLGLMKFWKRSFTAYLRKMDGSPPSQEHSFLIASTMRIGE